jgi:hypothetical protein
MTRRDGIAIATLIGLLVLVVFAWPSEFVDDRPWCSGAAKISNPMRDTCQHDVLPSGWVLTHPSGIALVLIAVVIIVTIAWLRLRSRPS